MRVLTACEMSGRVRDAFRAKGHDAWLCDLVPSLVPGPHIQRDVRDVLHDGWDLVIAFPPCTDIAVSGALHFAAKRADGRQQKAIEFFMEFPWSATKVCIENPVGIMSSLWRKPNQVIQPWQFGHNESKKTCLWLQDLPELRHTGIVPPKGWRLVKHAADCAECDCCDQPWCDEHEMHYSDCDCIGPTQDGATYRMIDGYLFATLEENPKKPVWSNQTPSGQNKLGPSEARAMIRGLTYPGIATAMAEQWG